ncbi:hypothetical protein TCAL_09828, partial [Tigriopus californicus]|eukprot:TCALIF_09828-PA protein Name:"Similar to TTC25 Tetratricopeptide repeat protein 25 (Homo sapiens)" AED:0.23 eAED:0.25 QI:10/0.5/0.4/0.8/0.75/0.6/5/0/468
MTRFISGLLVALVHFMESSALPSTGLLGASRIVPKKEDVFHYYGTRCGHLVRWLWVLMSDKKPSTDNLGVLFLCVVLGIFLVAMIFVNALCYYQEKLLEKREANAMANANASRPERRRTKATSSVDILGFRVKRQNDEEMSCPLLGQITSIPLLEEWILKALEALRSSRRVALALFQQLGNNKMSGGPPVVVNNDSIKEDQERIRQIRKNKLFRRIEADIKERDRKRKPGRPEQYVDRDRIIAVTLGESDIRDTMVRQRMFISKNSNVVYEDEANYKVLIQQAEYELHKGAYGKALSYLHRACGIVPEDTVSLLLRGACYVGIQEFERGIQDVDVVIQFDPSSRAYLVKGDALYHLGDFEHALVYYNRALFKSCTTKEDEAVRFGISRAEKAIDNALGPQAISHFLTMRDLDYLEDLADEIGHTENGQKSRPDKDNSSIQKEAEDAISFLKNRQEFWRQFKPMYSEGI